MRWGKIAGVSGIVFIVSLAGILSIGVGPGADNGSWPANPGFPVDPFWKGNWACVYTQNDVTTGTHINGITIWDLEYRDNARGDINYNYYIKELTIPWISIKMLNWNNGQIKLYPHDDKPQQGGTPVNKIMFNGCPCNGQGNYNGFNEGNPTTFEAWFDLDFDGDGFIEFCYRYRMEFHGQNGPPPGRAGFIRVMISETLHPYYDFNGDGDEDPGEEYWHQMPDGTVDKIDYIEYSYLIDADVYDTSSNNISLWNGVAWAQQNIEAGPIAPVQGGPNGRIARIENPTAIIPPPPANPVPRYVSLRETPDGHTMSWVWCLAAHQNEYSQYPTNYVNNENLIDEDVQLWYTERFTVGAGQFPPWFPQWAEIHLYDFEA